jgi:enoyl-CoA hydratase
VSDEILTERRRRVLVITINRPEARNAVNRAVSQGLADAVDELDEDADLSVAIPGRGLGFTERPPRKPLISAVEGNALAGGTEVVLATDLVVASRAAKFGIPEVKRGLVAAGRGLLRLPRRIPHQKALDHIIPIFTSNDATEGAIAFAEKRTPNWTGT